MFGLLADQGVGSIPWSPLAAGRIARPWGDKGTERAVKNPTSTCTVEPASSTPTPQSSRRQEIADTRGVPMAQIALAGCCTTRSSTQRSPEQPSRTTSATR